jgi:hypothetical protein
MAAHKIVAQGFRSLFFLCYLLGLLGLVYGARMLSGFHHEQDRLREKRIEQLFLEKNARV